MSPHHGMSDKEWDIWRDVQQERDAIRSGAFCEDCGEVVTSANECEAIGLDPDAPRCKWCCLCTDCATALRSDLEDGAA